MDQLCARSFVDQLWMDSIVPRLIEYIRIPNLSPHFDPDWRDHGYMDDAVQLVSRWCEQNAPSGMKIEVLRLPGRTPLLVMEIPGQTDDTVQ